MWEILYSLKKKKKGCQQRNLALNESKTYVNSSLQRKRVFSSKLNYLLDTSGYIYI